MPNFTGMKWVGFPQYLMALGSPHENHEKSDLPLAETSRWSCSPWQAVGPVGAAALSTQSAGPLSGQRKVILASLISVCSRVDVLPRFPSWQVLKSPRLGSMSSVKNLPIPSWILGYLFNQNVKCSPWNLWRPSPGPPEPPSTRRADWIIPRCPEFLMENLKDFEICQVEFTIYPYIIYNTCKYGWLEPRFTGHLIYLAQSKSMKSHAGDSCSWKELRRAKSGRGGTLGVKHGWAWAQTNLKEEGVIANRGNFGTQWLCIPSIS